MLGHQSAVLTMDTYADLFPDDVELVSAALDKARQAALELTADQLRTGTERNPDQEFQSGPLAGHFLVGVAGFEPTTSSSRTKRAAKLRYTPVVLGQSS